MRPCHTLSSTLLGAACLAVTCAAPAVAADGLVSLKAAAPIVLDGAPEAAWEQAQVLKVVLDKTPYKPADYKGATSTAVELKSLYDAEHIYFLMRYADPTRSVARAPWVKQEDGTWKQLKQRDSTGHDNTHYEDKFAFFWDINTRGFAKLGCAVACHMAVDGKVNGVEDTSAGRKYTNKAGETIDMWHWKGVRTGMIGQIDDQFVNDNNPPNPKDWGRRGDDKTGGGYADNIKEDKSGPAFMSAKSDGEPYWIRDEDKVPFVDTFKPGDIVAGIIVKPFTGSRGDLASAAKWENGTWTVEFKRKLVTAGEKAAVQDVQFSDLAKTYAFGVAVFDNTQINHLYHEGALKLSFKP